MNVEIRSFFIRLYVPLFVEKNQRVAAYECAHRRRYYRLNFHTPIYYIKILTLNRKFLNFSHLKRFFVDKAKTRKLRRERENFFAGFLYQNSRVRRRTPKDKVFRALRPYERLHLRNPLHYKIRPMPPVPRLRRKPVHSRRISPAPYCASAFVHKQSARRIRL